MRRDAVALLLVAAAAMLVFAPSLGGTFVWDDRSLLLENRFLGDWSNVGTNLTSDFFRRSGVDEKIGHWRPAVTLSYMVDRSLWGDAPAGYHAVNVLLHAIASCLVFLLARSLGLPRVAAGLAGVLFAVHPAHVESVAWISGRTDLLCAVPALAALLVDARRGREGGRGAPAGIFALTLVALLAKEMAVAVAAGTVLRALLLPSERERRLGAARAAAGAAAAPVLACAAYAVLRLGVVGIPPEAPAAASAGRLVLFWTWWRGVLDYLRVLVWPADLGIVPRVGLAAGPADPRVLGGLLAFAILVAAAWWGRARWRAGAWAAAFFLAALLPLTNFVVPIRAPAGVAFPWAERFLYLPSAGFVLALAAAMAAARGRVAGRVASVAAVAVVALLAARTWARVPDWKNERALFGAEVARAPEAGTAWLGLADALARDGETVDAERHYREAIALSPMNAYARFNLGNLLLGRGDLGEAERAYRDALAIRPRYGKAWMNLGIALARQGRIDEAVEALRRAVEEMPASPEARHNLDAALRRKGTVPFSGEREPGAK